jgi:N-hydroxyarylamine O-acetyltransferase
MDITAYLYRIGLPAPPPVTALGLAQVHRAHAGAIPYEGLDIQLGHPLDLDEARIFDKLVRRQRGGWCYENNGLLGWALGEMGFSVQRCVAGVYRRERGDAALGNHLMLLVHLDEPWLCDLGLGDGLRAPLPLQEGTHSDGDLTFRLEHLPDGFWRFHNHPNGSPASFDFTTAPADEGLLLATNHRLQTDPESHFVLNAEAIRMTPGGSLTLLGRVLRQLGADGLTKTLITGPDHMAQVLDDEFGITGVDCAAIWPRILARHAALFAEPDPAP